MELPWLLMAVSLGAGQEDWCAQGTIPAAFTSREAKTSSRGVIVASYERAGAVQIGSFP